MYEELIEKQEEIRKKVLLIDNFRTPIRVIGGVDQAFIDDVVISCIVVCEYKTFEIKEVTYSKMKVKFPYIPGFLAFREGPVIAKTWKKLKSKPDILLVDGNGILHPRMAGLASHIGVLLNVATIGVAKSLLCGKVKNGKVYIDEKQVGFELVTKKGCKPIYVSPGHKVSIKTSVEIVKSCLKGYKLPEPLRLAHIYVNKIKKLKLMNVFI